MTGLLRELNPGPLAPEARIMPLDQAAACRSGLNTSANETASARLHAFLFCGVFFARGLRSRLRSLLLSARLRCAPSWMTGPHRSVTGKFAVHDRSHHRLCGSGLFQGGSRCTSGFICIFAAQLSSARRPPLMRHVHTGLCQGKARRTRGLICCLCYAALDWLVPRHG